MNVHFYHFTTFSSELNISEYLDNKYFSSFSQFIIENESSFSQFKL